MLEKIIRKGIEKKGFTRGLLRCQEPLVKHQWHALKLMQIDLF